MTTGSSRRSKLDSTTSKMLILTWVDLFTDWVRFKLNTASQKDEDTVTEAE